MWEKVNRRRHNAIKIFPFGSGSDEAMLYGTVEYGLKDGREASVDWAARAHLVKESGSVKMDFYQVYLVRNAWIHATFLLTKDSGYRCTKRDKVGSEYPM